jgi:recombination protein RecA
VDSAAQAVIAKINKKYGEGTILLGADIKHPFLERIPSGSLSLDVALSGGWPTNHWTEILGWQSAGKTMVALKTIATNQERDPHWMAVWFAAEDFVDDYARMMGCDLDRIIVMNEQRMEIVYEAALEFIENQSVDCMVIDSLPALVPMREVDGSMEDFQPGLAAFLTGKFFRKAGTGMGRAVGQEGDRPVAGFILNQWRNKIGGYGDPKISPGGLAKNFFCFVQVEIVREEWLKNTKGENIGQTLKITNKKNKQAPPGRVAHIDAYFAPGNGFKAGEWDSAKDTVEAGIAYGTIERSGAYYEFVGHRFQGRARMIDALREDEELHQKVRAAVLADSVMGEEFEEPEPEPKPRRRKVRNG